MKHGTYAQNVEISAAEIDEWGELFPGVNVPLELKKAEGWLRANPDRPKKKLRRFFYNWLAKTHGRLQEAEVSALVRVAHKREQERADSAVGLWEGYK